MAGESQGRGTSSLAALLALIRSFSFITSPGPNGLASRRKYTQVCKNLPSSFLNTPNFALQPKICQNLRWVAKRTRKSVRKITQVAKSGKFHACIVDLRSTRDNLRTNLSSAKANASHRKPTQVGGQTKRKLNLRRLASPFGQGFRENIRVTRGQNGRTCTWRLRLCMTPVLYLLRFWFLSSKPHSRGR